MRVTRRRLMVLGGLCLLVVGTIWFVLFRHPGPTVDAVALAKSETRMWQAYYDKDLLRLRGELGSTLRNQFGLSRYRTWQVSNQLALAAIHFARSGGAPTGDKREALVQDIASAYEGIRAATGLDFDAREAAEAELGWWAARRTAGQNSVEQVGGAIETLYAVLYGGSNDLIYEAAMLRAEAAHVRDTSSDWVEVEHLLIDSYRNLLAGTDMS